MKLIIEINSSNAAFANNETGEIKRILFELAGRIDCWKNLDSFVAIGDERRLFDINGNAVGRVSLHYDKQNTLRPTPSNIALGRSGGG